MQILCDPRTPKFDMAKTKTSTLSIRNTKLFQPTMSKDKTTPYSFKKRHTRRVCKHAHTMGRFWTRINATGDEICSFPRHLLRRRHENQGNNDCYNRDNKLHRVPNARSETRGEHVAQRRTLCEWAYSRTFPLPATRRDVVHEYRLLLISWRENAIISFTNNSLTLLSQKRQVSWDQVDFSDSTFIRWLPRV